MRGIKDIGNLVRKKYGIEFLGAEKIRPSMKEDCFSEAYFRKNCVKVEGEIIRRFRESSWSVTESPDAQAVFHQFLISIRRRYTTRRIGIKIPPYQRRDRIETRNPMHQTQVPDNLNYPGYLYINILVTNHGI